MNPSENPTILFSISFLDPTAGTSRLSENLTLEISIGEYVSASPPTENEYLYPDGNTNADSDQYSSPSVDLTDEGDYGSVQGYFEAQYDNDRIMFKSQYTGTHRLNLTFNVPVAASSVYPGDLAECYDSDNTGFQKFFQGSNVNSFTKVDQDIYFVNYDVILM